MSGHIFSLDRDGLISVPTSETYSIIRIAHKLSAVRIIYAQVRFFYHLRIFGQL